MPSDVQRMSQMPRGLDARMRQPDRPNGRQAEHSTVQALERALRLLEPNLPGHAKRPLNSLSSRAL
jgi:hypothetical protein